MLCQLNCDTSKITSAEFICETEENDILLAFFPDRKTSTIPARWISGKSHL